MPAPPDRRLVWVIRLVFYPAALALVALSLYHRHAAAAAEPAVAVAPVARVGYIGQTSQDLLTTAVVEHGQVRRVRTRYWLRCAGRRVTTWHQWDERLLLQRRDVVTAIEGAGHAYTWWQHPGATSAFALHARVDDQTLTGTFSVVVRTHDRRGPGVCRSGVVRFTLSARRG